MFSLLKSFEIKALNDKARAKAPGEFVTTRIGTTHYQVSGPEDGEPVLLVHGFAIPFYVWERTAPALASAGYRVIAYDLMGRGYSDRPAATYDIDYFVQQIDELLDSLSVTKPINIVGYSMGGAIAASYCNQRPLRVARAAFLAPFNTAQKVGPLSLPVLGDLLAKAVLMPIMPTQQGINVHRPKDFPDAGKRFQQQMQYRGFARAIHSSLKTIINRNHLQQYHRLADFAKPKLLIWGENDRVLPFSEHAEVLAAMGDTTFLSLSECGHSPQLEFPDIVNKTLCDWLAQPS